MMQNRRECALSPDTSADRTAIVRNVILLHRRGWSVRAIAEDLGLPKSTVHDAIGRWRRSVPCFIRELIYQDMHSEGDDVRARIGERPTTLDRQPEIDF
jgi:IS30 family transposase